MTTTYASPALDLPGAVPAPDSAPDSGVPWHYGDPHGEQRALAAGRAYVDLSDRSVVTVSGPDRLGWLHSITTAYLEGLAAGVPMLGLVLSPHGHVEHELHLVDDGATTWIVTETAPALIAYLESMRFLLRVEIADVTDTYAVVGSIDAPAPGGVVWAAPGQYRSIEAPDEESRRYVPARPASWPAYEAIIPRAGLAEVLVAGPGLAGTWAWEALRVGAGVPRAVLDADHRTIPHELGLVPTGVHLHKGCYRGQETVARVHNLGRPPRRLVLLHLDGSDPHEVSRGAAVELDGRTVGLVTSLARHHELGPIALAVVKRSVPLDAALTADGVAAGQEPVVVA